MESKGTRKNLAAVAKLNDKTPATTAAVRKAVHAAHREEVLAHPLASDHTEWLMRVARGEIEAPSAVQSLALKQVNELFYGTEVAPTQAGNDKVIINITGIGAPQDVPGITIEGTSGGTEDE
jgi:hypothetical protein